MRVYDINVDQGTNKNIIKPGENTKILQKNEGDEKIHHEPTLPGSLSYFSLEYKQIPIANSI